MPENFEHHREENDSEYESIETFDISSEEFLQGLTSEDFNLSLKLAAQETKKNGLETSFRLHIDKNKKSYIKEVIAGGTVSAGSPSSADVKILKKFKEKKEFKNGNLLDFHFHPDENGAIIPSAGDLRTTAPYSFLGVGMVREKNEIDILLIRKKSFISDGELIEIGEQYDQQRPDFTDDQESIRKILEDEGFESFLISFLKNQGSYELKEDSKKTILEIKNIKVKI